MCWGRCPSASACVARHSLARPTTPLLPCSLFGLVPVTAPYLPWVLLGLTLALGSAGAVFDCIGIAVGHVYYYFEDVYPAVAESRGWRLKKILPTPSTLCVLCCGAALLRCYSALMRVCVSLAQQVVVRAPPSSHSTQHRHAEPLEILPLSSRLPRRGSSAPHRQRAWPAAHLTSHMPLTAPPWPLLRCASTPCELPACKERKKEKRSNLVAQACCCGLCLWVCDQSPPLVTPRSSLHYEPGWMSQPLPLETGGRGWFGKGMGSRLLPVGRQLKVA